MQRLAAEGGSPGQRVGRRLHPVLDRRRPRDPGCGRQVVRQALHDDAVAAEGQMRPVLLGGPDRHQQGGTSAQPVADGYRGHVLQPPRTRVVRHLARWWAVLVLVVGAAAAEWLRQPSAGRVLAAWLSGAAAIAALHPWSGWRRRGLALAMGALVAGLTITNLRLRAVETAWDKQRAATVESASATLARRLHLAYRAVNRLAADGAATAGGPRDAAFGRLARAVPVFGPEMGVAVLDSSGAPWAWAGRYRLPPTATGDSIAVRMTGYYVVLEARRHSANGKVAIASVLVWAHASVPERDRSLAEILRGGTDVSLVFYPPGAGPSHRDL